MPILTLLVSLIVILLVFWAAKRLLAAFGVGEPITTVVYVGLVIVLIIWLLGAAGFGPGLGNLRLT